MQRKLPRDDPAHVQEIHDHLILGTRILLDDVEGARDAGLVESPGPEQSRPQQHDAQGSLELVGQHGEELVLGPAGRFGLDPRRSLPLVETCPRSRNR